MKSSIWNNQQDNDDFQPVTAEDAYALDCATNPNREHQAWENMSAEDQQDFINAARLVNSMSGLK